MTKPDYVVVAFSGGKDSTAMVVRMMELGERIDEVINYDTGLEFPSMYEHIEKVKRMVEDYGAKFTTLRNRHGFEYYLYDKKIIRQDGSPRRGYGWPGPLSRWCTSNLKTSLSKRYFKELRKKYNIYECIGIAADEVERLNRPSAQEEHLIHPLAIWGWTEADCLRYCYEKGFDWGGLYEHFDRVSCWCCPLQNLEELYKLWTYYPDLWEQLKVWDSKVIERYGKGRYTFKPNYDVFDLEKRFEVRKKYEEAGLPTNTAEFHKEVKEVLGR